MRRPNGNEWGDCKAVAEATRVAIQIFAEAQSQRSEGQWGPKLGGPTLKQPQFNWKLALDFFIFELFNVSRVFWNV